MSRRADLACLVVGWAVVMQSGACTESDPLPASMTATDRSMPSVLDKRAPHAVALPDVSHMTVSVRDQIHEQYSSLLLRIDNPGATTVELGRAYGEMGNLLMAAQYVDAAEPFYLNAQVLAPADRRWPYYLGHLHRNQGAFTKAAASFEQALRLQPDDMPTMVWLGEVRLAQGRPEAAEVVLEQALLVQPGWVAARSGLGRAALARHDYAQAVQHLDEALAMNQRATALHYPLAMAHRGLGDSGRAEAHLRRWGTVDVGQPDPLMQEIDLLLESSGAYEARGVRALERGNGASAAAYFRRGIELAPTNPSLRHRLGIALFLMGDASGAHAQFEEALRASPDFAKAHYSLGVIMEASGRDPEAVERFSAAVRDEPSYMEARLSLAGIMRRTGRLNEALSQYESLIRIAPRLVGARFGYAMALVGLHRYQEARDRLSEGMQRHPDQPIFARALARILAAAPDDAVRDAPRAIALVEELLEQQRSIDLGETMAMALAERGFYEDAVRWQRDVMAVAEHAGRADLVEGMAVNLRLYERRQPSRTPWRDDAIP